MFSAGEIICRAERSLPMKALRSWATTDLAMPLRSGISDPVRGRSTFGVTPSLRRAINSMSRRSEFSYDSARLPQEDPVPKDFPSLSEERNLSKNIRTVTRLRMYSARPSRRVQRYGVRGFYRFGYRHIFLPRRPPAADSGDLMIDRKCQCNLGAGWRTIRQRSPSLDNFVQQFEL